MPDIDGQSLVLRDQHLDLRIVHRRLAIHAQRGRTDGHIGFG